MRTAKIFVWSLIIITGIILGIGLILMDFSSKMVFQPLKISREEAVFPPNLKMKRIEIHFPHSNLDAQYLKVKNSKYIVLFAHNGSGILYDYVPLYKGFKKLGLSVLAFDYRGYGLSKGEGPTEESIVEDVRRAMHRVHKLHWKRKNTILYGQGIGAYALARKAVKKKYAAFIAENAVPSLSDLEENTAMKLLLAGRFDLGVQLKSMVCPVFFIHSSNHPSIPLDKMRSFLKSTDPEIPLYVIQNGDHRSLAASHPGKWMKLMRRILDKIKRNAALKPGRN